MNGEVSDVGTVVHHESNNYTVIVGIVLGILAALVVGAGLALFVMIHLRKKKRGEKNSVLIYFTKLATVIKICKNKLILCHSLFIINLTNFDFFL